MSVVLSEIYSQILFDFNVDNLAIRVEMEKILNEKTNISSDLMCQMKETVVLRGTRFSPTFTHVR